MLSTHFVKLNIESKISELSVFLNKNRKSSVTDITYYADKKLKYHIPRMEKCSHRKQKCSLKSFNINWI